MAIIGHIRILNIQTLFLSFPFVFPGGIPVFRWIPRPMFIPPAFFPWFATNNITLFIVQFWACNTGCTNQSIWHRVGINVIIIRIAIRMAYMVGIFWTSDRKLRFDRFYFHFRGEYFVLGFSVVFAMASSTASSAFLFDIYLGVRWLVTFGTLPSVELGFFGESG